MANCDTLIPALLCEEFLSNNKVNFRFASNRSYTKYKPWFENALDLTVKSYYKISSCEKESGESIDSFHISKHSSKLFVKINTLLQFQPKNYLKNTLNQILS